MTATVTIMTKKRQELGPTALQVAKNVRRLRQQQGMSLADLVKATGERLSLDAVKKIEAAANPKASTVRRVDVDELMVLSIALGVNPSALLLPVQVNQTQPVEVTGAHRVLRAEEAWDWVRGEEPVPTPGRPYLPGTFRESVNPSWVASQMQADADRKSFFGAQWVEEESDGTDT